LRTGVEVVISRTMGAEPGSPAVPRRAPGLRTVRARLVLLIAICFVPLGVGELYLARRLWVHARHAELEANREVAQAVALVFEGFVLAISQHAQTLGLALQALSPESAAAGELLAEAEGAYPSVREFLWVDANGVVRASSHAEALELDVGDRDYFAELARGRDVVVSDLVRAKLGGEPVFVIGRALRGRGGALRGAVLAVVDPGALSQRVFPLERGASGSFGLLDRSGRVVFRSPPPGRGWDPMRPVEPDALVSGMGDRGSAVGAFRSPLDGERRLAAVVAVGRTGWLARASRADAVALGPVMRELRVQAAVALGLALVALLLAVWVSRGITGPLRRLRRSIAMLSRAELPRVEPGGPAEIRTLAEAYNDMAERLLARDAELAAASARLEEGLRSAESAAVEARRERERLDAVFGAIADGLVIYDAGGRILALNGPAERLLGFSPEDRDRTPRERWARFRLVDAEGRELSAEETPLSRALAGERVRGFVLGIEPRRPEAARGVLWVSSSAAPVHDERGARVGVVSVFTDITALRELQEQREDLLRTVSHDLRTPLNVIGTHAHLLLREAGDPGTVRRRAEGISASVRRMATLIKDIIDLARFDSGQLRLEREPIFAFTFIDDALRHVRGALPTERVRVYADPDLPMILADPDRLERVLLNLVSNALKYSSPETEVRVELRPADGGVEIAVSDRGPGISAEDLPRLFTRYGRGTAAVPGGTGLGLFITRTLVEAHGGRVAVESRAGEGSTFRVWLPVMPGSPAE
jgi:PAS domain S-box-containing protein